MKTAVIVEDEVNARALLSHFLFKYCDLDVVGEAQSVAEGIDVIRRTKPDIVFLDIALQDDNGFELLRRLQPWSFEVIFVTAFDHYAIQAIKLSAVDYLLKPVDISELRLAVEKALAKIQVRQSNQNLELLLDNLNHPENRRIVLIDGNSYTYVEVRSIIRLRAQGRYTDVYISTGKRYVVSRNLGEFDKLLSQYRFLRVHHSHLVNPDHIVSYEKRDGGLVMSDKSTVEVSRRNRDALISFLKQT